MGYHISTMVSESAILGDILEALGSVKNQISVLSLRLENAEQKLSKLEHAVYTLPVSPTVKNSCSNEASLPPATVFKQTFDEIHRTMDGSFLNVTPCPSTSSTLSGETSHIRLNPEDLSTLRKTCDLLKNLKPISNILTAFSTMSSNVEPSVGSPAPELSSPTPIESGSLSSEQKNTSTSEQTTQPQLHLGVPTKSKEAPPASSLPKHPTEWRPPCVRHVFGQPSTLWTRNSSFDIPKSAFESYKNETSPFQQYVTWNKDRPSCLLKVTK